MKATLDSTTKEALRHTIRSLRERLLADFHAALEGEYQLAVKPSEARLSEAQRVKRARLEAWVEEQVRSASGAASSKGLVAGSGGGKSEREARDRFVGQAVKEAAYTYLHRLVFIRSLEAHGLLRPFVLTGGWSSPAHRELREHAPELCQDETEGFGVLLRLVFSELALDLPGLFGDVGLTSIVPLRPETLRFVIEELDKEELKQAWKDDTTLGWVYQYWNDPEREKLDEKINAGGKIAPHEIASKTQMFTERYMVEWLLQNSLGLTWLAICQKNGWTPDAHAVLPVLEARRVAFRAEREAGKVPLDALMPIASELEDQWKYFVAQPIPTELLCSPTGEVSVAKAPTSIKALKLLDPACGSGHFLVIAFDLLAAFYREEARHTGEAISDAEIAASILENNLFGIDIDPRAIQVAAAALMLKARSFAKDVRPKALHLVAPVFRLAKLPKNDPAVLQLQHDLLRESGIAEELTQKLLTSLEDVDHLGSLLRVSVAIAEAVKGQSLLSYEQGNQAPTTKSEDVQASVLDRLEAFLAVHSRPDDLGLRLDGEQLAAGIRFVRMVQEDSYDVVVGNPPYQGLSKTESFGYVARTYPRGKADLYAAFLERGLQLAREGGLSAMLTMRGWMFLTQFTALRSHLLHGVDLRLLGDVDRGAFEAVADEVLSTVMSVVRRGSPTASSIAMQPTPTDDRSRDAQRTNRKRAAVLAQVGRYEFDPRGFQVIEGEPIVYWWTKEFLRKYAEAPKLGDVAPVRQGAATSDNGRFLRRPWEVIVDVNNTTPQRRDWVPYIKGGAGRKWVEPVSELLRWQSFGLELKAYAQLLYGSYTRTIKNEGYYFSEGVCFAPIGSSFSARRMIAPSVFGHMGSAAFGEDLDGLVCLMNSSYAASVLQSLNPGIHFEVGDVARLPAIEIPDAGAIWRRVRVAFDENEATSEPSSGLLRPGPSAWQYAQDWAQCSVDRPEGAPLPSYEPVYDAPEPVAFVSFAIGVALGRFGADGEGILQEAPSSALPEGILFVAEDGLDSLEHPAAKPVIDAWEEHGKAVGAGDELRAWLMRGFFEHHKKLYENRPIYFPLSSSKKSFVAWVSIHRWRDATLRTLLAEHLLPRRVRFDGEVATLRTAKESTDRKQAREAEKRFAQVMKWREELEDFIAKVEQLASKGAPQIDPKCKAREVDAPFHLHLDDGVMIHAAALWPLLDAHWKDPKKWWRELATGEGKKDYDWAHLAKRYWPLRVEAKCKEDPSLAVAHGTFWKHHPAKAYAWELRLQHELEQSTFTIDEAGSDEAREAFLKMHPAEALEIAEKEKKRRERKSKSAGESAVEDARAVSDLFAEDVSREGNQEQSDEADA